MPTAPSLLSHRDHSGARRPVGRLSAIARPADVAARPTGVIGRTAGSTRQVDFVAFVAAKLKATPGEIAAARNASVAMRAKLDGLAAGRSVPARRGAAPQRADGLLPFPPFDGPTPAASPADAAANRRYTRTAV